jgi:hypothetical protein
VVVVSKRLFHEDLDNIDFGSGIVVLLYIRFGYKYHALDTNSRRVAAMSNLKNDAI